MPENTPTKRGYRVPIPNIDHFSAFDRAFMARDSSLDSFLSPTLDRSNLEVLIRDKEKRYRMRKVLCSSLQRQYAGLDIPKAVKENLEALQDSGTFCVTTAHQPLLFGGKLYVLYKALSTILLARSVSELSGRKVVPIFVIGSEDHDIEEVRYFKLFQSRLSWEPQGSGPVGRMALGNVPKLLMEMGQAFEALPFGDFAMSMVSEAYRQGDTFSQSFRKLLHGLLGHLGLIILDPDEADLKRGFLPVIQSELEESFSFNLVNSTIKQIESRGYKGQAHPREINLFYMEHGIRARIERKPDGSFHAVDTPYTWSKQEMQAFLQEHPERFSPNVILRPLYQETILPNLVFVGGGGELAYWIQLKDTFEAMDIPYPFLHRRQSVCLADEGTVTRMQKLGVEWQDLSEPLEEKIKEFVKSLEEGSVDLSAEKEAITRTLEGVRERSGRIDPTLQRSLDSTEHQIMKLLETFEARLVRGLKHRHETEVQQLRNLFDRVHPNQSLQERQEDFMTWLARFGPDLIDQLAENFKPLEPDFIYQEV